MKRVIITLFAVFLAVPAYSADYTGTATGAELDYVHGVTSSIQNQLNGKIAVGGNAGTATALAADPAGCAGGQVTTDINASGTATCTAWTANVLSMVGAADYAAIRTLLGLGTAALQNVGTLTNTKFCTYVTGTGIVCNSDGGSGASVDDTAYDATTWDGVTTTAPSKNAVRDYLESKLPSASDGSNGLVMSNNTTRTPTAATDEIYFEANVFKVNQNGTESSVVIGPTGTQINFSGTLTDGKICTYSSTGNAIACNTTASGGGNVSSSITSVAGEVATYTDTAGTTVGKSYVKFSGPASTVKTFTLPNSDATVTYTVASGTSALGTSAISSGACATVVTTSAPGVVTTDVPDWGWNTRISQVTGYGGATTGALRVDVYPTADNINVEVCNPTASSITPGAVTINWRVRR